MRNKFVSLKALALLVVYPVPLSTRNRSLFPNSNNGREKTATLFREKMPGLSVPPKIPNYCE